MNLDQIPQGDDPIPSMACVAAAAKRLRCSATPDDLVSKVLVDNNTSSWPAPVHLLDDENLLQEILLRLPPMPSSLPRASLVCSRWRTILFDHQFLKNFRKHHRKPPLLRFFEGMPGCGNHVFTFILETPDCIPAVRFNLPPNLCEEWDFMGCRHGLVVMFKVSGCQPVVFDPLIGKHHRLASPPVMNLDYMRRWNAIAVLCADAKDGHVHGEFGLRGCLVRLIS